MGEKAPFETFDLSHGICDTCAAKGLDLSDADTKHLQDLVKMQKDLYTAGILGTSPLATEILIENAIQIGIRPIDILLGFVTPLLHDIGRKWETGATTIAEEHRYTAVCEEILNILELKMIRNASMAQTKSEGLEILIIPAPSNIHTLGCRISALGFLSDGVNAKAIYPGIPAAEFPQILKKYSPKYLGISLSLSEQVTEVNEVIKIIGTSNIHPLPKIVVSGFVVKKMAVQSISGATLISDSNELLHQILASRKNKVA